MSPRVPFVVVLVVAMGGAVVAGQARDETPTVTPTAAEPGLDMPAVPTDDVVSSTWYCAAGTAEPDGMADHRVIVLNPGDVEVTGTVNAYAGSIASGSADDASGDEGADDESDGRSGSDDGSADGDEDATGGGSQGSVTGGDEAGREGEPTVGDAWSGDQSEDAAGISRIEPAAREDVRVPPGGRAELRLADLHESPLAAALVELDGPAVVEHEVSGPQGRDLGPCASGASPDWHFAWGATSRDAREVLVLFNPFPSVATVDIELSTDDGTREPVRYQGVPVPAGGVVGLDVGDEVRRRDQVAATVRSRSGPIVVERMQSFDGSRDVEGLSVSLGAPSPLETWVFAHGRRSSGRGERIVLYNPTGERAEVDVVVRPASDGQDEGETDAPPPQPFGVTVAPGGYEVVDYNEEDRVVPGTNHATVVRSRNGVPVVAERVLTFTRRRPAEADITAGPGASLAATSWTAASLGGGRRSQGAIVAYNPDPERPARLSVTGLVDGREVVPDELQDVEIPAGEQRQIPLTENLQGGASSLVVESDSPVVVERLAATPGGFPQAVAPGLPSIDGTVPLSRLDLPT